MQGMRRPVILLAAAAVALAPAVPAAAAPLGDVSPVNLGSLGDWYSGASGLNDRDQVVGYYTNTSDMSKRLAFVWNRGKLTPLDAVTPGFFAEAKAINNRGTIVGTSVGALGMVATVWVNGKPSALSNVESSANAINDRGQTVGQQAGRAARWDNGRPVTLEQLSGTTLSDAKGINERGEAVGECETPTSHVCTWDRLGHVKDLGLGIGAAINDAGTVAGIDASQGGLETWHPAIYKHGKVTRLAGTPQYYNTVTGINNREQVTGGYGNRAVIWQRGQVVTLPSLATQYVGTIGSAINQSGHVAGSTNGEPPPNVTPGYPTLWR